MRYRRGLVFLFSVFLLMAFSANGQIERVRIKTDLGDILVELYPEKAPLTVANFLAYVDAGAYDNSRFFRVVRPDNQPRDKVKIEVIQGGDLPEDRCRPSISLETTAQTGIKHVDGAISMARGAPDTASCSFFICINDQPELDFAGRRNPDGQGFAAFGKVISGMDVVRSIQQRPVAEQMLQVPVVIVSITRQ